MSPPPAIQSGNSTFLSQRTSQSTAAVSTSSGALVSALAFGVSRPRLLWRRASRLAMASSSSEVTAARRRIVDYLNDGEELGVEGAAVEMEPPPCTPASAVAVGEPARSSALPRFRWPRLVRHGLRRKGSGGDKGKQEEDVVVGKGDDDLPAAAAAVSTSSGCEESSAASDKRQPDLGVGLSLVFLLAKTSDEFNKMVKVRAEMEALLKDIRDEVRIKNSGGTGTSTDGGHDATKDSNRESTTSSCVTTDGNEVQSARARMEMEYRAASSSGVEHAGYEKSSSAEDGGGCCARMDVLEEEFHAEMELLQVNYGSETPSFLPDPEEDEEHYSKPYDEMADYRDGADDDSGGVVDDDHDRDDDDDDGDAEYYNGVSAVQLERRLHELLHERNRDGIEELEAALRCAEQKLIEKEMEVSLWKDTAKLALRQDKKLQ